MHSHRWRASRIRGGRLCCLGNRVSGVDMGRWAGLRYDEGVVVGVEEAELDGVPDRCRSVNWDDVGHGG